MLELNASTVWFEGNLAATLYGYALEAIENVAFEGEVSDLLGGRNGSIACCRLMDGRLNPLADAVGRRAADARYANCIRAIHCGYAGMV